jgi:asparagine synthetase B (glutamine-hydrolysing)
MSWIFGVLDEAGVSTDRVREAAAHLPIAGSISLAGGERCAVGSVGGELPVEAVDGILAVADGRLDADGDQSLHIRDNEAAGWLADLIQERGVEALDGVAGDFSFAMFDPDENTLLLTRDLAGVRPLFWARIARGALFASDPEFIRAYAGLGSHLDRGTAVRYLAGLPTHPSRTGLQSVLTVPGGRAVIAAASWAKWRRWFRPELDAPSTVKDPGKAVRRAIIASVSDRTSGERAALWLSGGRDSGALAVALAEARVDASCFTMDFDPGICTSETEEASALACSLGFEWTPVRQPTAVTHDDLARAPRLWPTPLSMPFVRSAEVSRDAVADRSCTVTLDGLGGELFAAHPIALLDLLRRGRPQALVTASGSFNDVWVHPYGVQWRVLARGLAPRPFLEWRERARPTPPWALPGLRGTLDAMTAPRSDREYTLAYLRWIGTAGLSDAARMHRPAGIVGTSPYFDRRVVRAAMQLTLADRLPTCTPKPLLARELLGGFSSTRVKGDQSGWFLAVAAEAEPMVAQAASSRSGLVRGGLIRPFDPVVAATPGWRVNSLRLVAVEAWLRRDPSGP